MLPKEDTIMVRKPRCSEAEVSIALALAESAKTVQQIRQAESILIPALTGASTATTAKILGISRSHVCLLRRLFRRAGEGTCADRELRGGRRHELISPEEERAVVEKWLVEAKSLGVATVAALCGRYEMAVGRKVPRSTVYRVLSRLGVQPPNRRS